MAQSLGTDQEAEGEIWEGTGVGRVESEADSFGVGDGCCVRGWRRKSFALLFSDCCTYSEKRARRSQDNVAWELGPRRWDTDGREGSTQKFCLFFDAF